MVIGEYLPVVISTHEVFFIVFSPPVFLRRKNGRVVDGVSLPSVTPPIFLPNNWREILLETLQTISDHCRMLQEALQNIVLTESPCSDTYWL